MNVENQELILLVAKLHYHKHQYSKYGGKSSLAAAMHYDGRVETQMNAIEFIDQTPPPRFKLRVNRHSYPVFSY